MLFQKLVTDHLKKKGRQAHEYFTDEFIQENQIEKDELIMVVDGNDLDAELFGYTTPS
jgi:hypothetical protein